MPLYNLKLSMLINDYAMQHMPFNNVKVQRISVLLVIKDMLAQRERSGTQREVEQESLTSVLMNVILMVGGMRANWSKD